MKKLTAGIFTVLMGLVSVNAADAAVASKAYVDAKAASEASAVQTAAATALSTAKTELEGKIDAKVAQTAYDAKIQELVAADATFATKTALEQGLATKQATIDDLQTIRDGAALGATSFQSANVANDGNQVDDDEKFVPTVAFAQKMIDDSQTDLISAVSDNTDAIALINDAENGILAAAKSDAEKYIDADELSASQTAQDTDLKKYADEKDTALKTELEGKITTASGSAAEVAEDLASYIAENNTAVADAKKAGTDAAAALEAYKSTNDTAVATAQSAAEAAAAAAAAAQTAADDAQADANQALADAAAAKTQADKGVADAAAAQATANAAIPAPSEQCSDPANKCVLTFNNSVYTWEVIERSNGQ